MEHFPMEINKASEELMVRIPGIGVRGARAIIRARRQHSLTFDDLRRVRISRKRARSFITAGGVMDKGVLFDPLAIYTLFANEAKRRQRKGLHEGQLSLFDAEEETSQQFLNGPQTPVHRRFGSGTELVEKHLLN
jgi:predicted DNA-binding helix-hairpin-helix protein